ncbi:hypothetical protein QZM89_33620 [Burkholderia gladioli]|uniref:hypothetical protein n=1 Tax=Burkholderia gladioli TaxID=28095 RepID=UPI00264E557C|nr:hypothetical protein [Burkholderia gladioli]MDN7500141.1 hypothetical protein [Burkholderia gladioli]
MLELIEWIRNGELIHKLASPYFWLAMGATAIAAQYRGGLTRSDSFLRFLSGTSEAIMLPI